MGVDNEALELDALLATARAGLLRSRPSLSTLERTKKRGLCSRTFRRRRRISALFKAVLDRVPFLARAILSTRLMERAGLEQLPGSAASEPNHQRFRCLSERWRIAVAESVRRRRECESLLELVAGWVSSARWLERVGCTPRRTLDQTFGVNRTKSGYRRLDNGGFGARRFSLPGGRFEVTQ
jgi:hypothetical protein